MCGELCRPSYTTKLCNAVFITILQLLYSPHQPEGNATGPANNSEDACGAEGGEDEGASGLGIFLIISTLAFVVFFAIGPGSIPWMCVGELFNQVFQITHKKTTKKF